MRLQGTTSLPVGTFDVGRDPVRFFPKVKRNSLGRDRLSLSLLKASNRAPEFGLHPGHPAAAERRRQPSPSSSSNGLRFKCSNREADCKEEWHGAVSIFTLRFHLEARVRKSVTQRPVNKEKETRL